MEAVTEFHAVCIAADPEEVEFVEVGRTCCGTSGSFFLFVYCDFEEEGGKFKKGEMAMESMIVKVGEAESGSEGVPSKGPMYRSIYARDGFPPLPEGIETAWDIFT